MLKGSAIARYAALAGPAGPLGWPTADTSSADPTGAFATAGESAPAVSTFTGGSLVAAAGVAGALSTAPAYELPAGPILDRWNAEGGTTGLLGTPTADTAAVPGGQQSLFTGGVLTNSPTRGAHELAGRILADWLALGGAQSAYGLPSSDAYLTAGGYRVDFGDRSIIEP